MSAPLSTSYLAATLNLLLPSRVQVTLAMLVSVRQLGFRYQCRDLMLWSMTKALPP
ncbi:putative fad dependent oxidoreductase [Moniliophthora roreri]|nr:putative fad dependent oxidoreductase [Moniliophthora roreri]